MKLSLPILTLIATIAVTTEATTDPAAIINLKSQIGNYVLSAAASALQAKQNLVRSSTAAIINAKTNFLQRQLPHLVRFKTNQINSVLELKKNLIKSKATQIGQLAGGGGNAIQATEQEVAPYSPPAAPPALYSPPAAPSVPLEEHHTSYNPLPLEPLPPAAPPAEVPTGPYPPPNYLAKRQLMNQELPTKNAHAQATYSPQQTASHEFKRNIHYSASPTPPPPPPVRPLMYV